VLLDKDGEIIDFHLTNYDGGSSSVLPLAGHTQMYPGIEVQNVVRLLSSTLESQLARLDRQRKFDALVLDVQGAELSVLRGAGSRLDQFRWVFTECADFEIYEGGCTDETLSLWLNQNGFRETKRFPKDHKPGLGSTFDVLFERI